MEEKAKETLKRFFTITTAVFDLHHTMQLALGGSSENKSYMHQLHEQAKEEMSKENPDANFIDDLLGLIETETKACKNN